MLSTAVAEFDAHLIDLEMQTRVVLRAEGTAVEILARVISVLEVGLPELIHYVDGAKVALQLMKAELQPSQERSVGRRIAVMTLLAAHCSFRLALARKLRERREKGTMTEELARACMVQASGVVPLEHPVEMWVDSLVPLDGGDVEA